MSLRQTATAAVILFACFGAAAAAGAHETTATTAAGEVKVISQVMKTKHDTAKASINNVR